MKNKEKNIKCIKTFRALKIYINNLLHIHILMDGHNSLQSWYESFKNCDGIDKRMYYIEFYRKEGEPMLMEYSDEQDWIAILKLLDNNI